MVDPKMLGKAIQEGAGQPADPVEHYRSAIESTVGKEGFPAIMSQLRGDTSLADHHVQKLAHDLTWARAKTRKAALDLIQQRHDKIMEFRGPTSANKPAS